MFQLIKNYSREIKIILFFAFIFILAVLWEAFLLRDVGNWSYPLSNELLSSPFYGELFTRSLNVWDDRFGLGFSNLLNSQGTPQYAPAYSGSMWVASNTINSLFQYISGQNFFFTQVVSLLLLGFSSYLMLSGFRPSTQGRITGIFLSALIALLIHSTGYLVSSMGSSGRFIAAQALSMIVFVNYHSLTRRRFEKNINVESFVPLAVSLSSLLFVFSPYFLSMVLLIGIHAMLQCFFKADRKELLFRNAKILALALLLIVVCFGYVIAPVFFSTSSSLMSEYVGRNDSPMPTSILNILRFYNDPSMGYLGWAGAWLPTGLATIGILVALFSIKMRRWALVDLSLIILLLFLAKGSASPYAEINHWLHVNIPFLRLLGSSYPYLGAIYTLLIYYLILGISCSLGVLEENLPRMGKYIGFAIVVTIVIVSIFRNVAYLSGDFGGGIQAIEYPKEYYDFKKIAERDMQDGRSYYFPDEGAQIGSEYIFSPTPPMGCCYDRPFSSAFPININWSNFNKNSGYYGQTMNFLMHNLQSGSELARIMSDTDTKYLVFDLSVKKTSLANERMLSIRDQVRTSKYFEYISEFSNKYLEVYKNNQWQPFVSSAKRITLATDDPSLFLDMVRARLSAYKKPVVVSGAISLEDAMKLKSSDSLEKVLFYNSDEMGLMLDLLHSQYETKPDANFLSSDGQSWFSYNRVYQAGHTEKNGGRFFGKYPVASVSDTARMSYHPKVLPNTKNRIFVRALVSPTSGRIMVSFNGNKRLLNLHSNGYVGIQWFDLGVVNVNEFEANADIEIESLDAGRSKIIDVLTVIPDDRISEALQKINYLFKGIAIDYIEKPSYLQWKQVYKVGGSNMTDFQNDSQIKPKKITLYRHNFFYREDFDHFDNGKGGMSFNLDAQNHEESVARKSSSDNFNFKRIYNGINYGFVASADTPAGIYSLKYELKACEPFSKLTLNLSTAYVTSEVPLTFYASDDGSVWETLAIRTSDAEGGKILDISEFARGKKKVFLKISYNKKTMTLGSIYLLDLKISGVAGGGDMDCESSALVNLKDKTYLPTLKSGQDSTPPKSLGDQSLKGGHEKGVIIFNRAFDPNWQIDGVRAFNINYGFSAFLMPLGKPSNAPLHSWQNVYRILLFCSLGFYIFLWLAFIWIWNSNRRERHGV